jgi:hypothetical protein
VVRRLPVIQSKTSDDLVAEARPPWHWVLIGAGFSVTIWLPLSAVALWVSARLPLGPLPILISFALACFAAGGLVGRFGGRSRAREAAAGGLLGATATWSLAALGGALTPWPVAVASLLVLAAGAVILSWLGGKLGVRLRSGLDLNRR